MRQFYYSLSQFHAQHVCFVLNKEDELFLCLMTSKMLSLGVFDRCESC